MLTDAANQVVKVGDRVAYVVVGKLFLRTGIIERLTPQGATIRVEKHTQHRHCRQFVKVQEVPSD